MNDEITLEEGTHFFNVVRREAPCSCAAPCAAVLQNSPVVAYSAKEQVVEENVVIVGKLSAAQRVRTVAARGR